MTPGSHAAFPPWTDAGLRPAGRLVQALAGVAGLLVALLFGLQQAGIALPVPLPPGTAPLPLLSALSHGVAAAAVLYAAAGRRRRWVRGLALALGVLATFSLLKYMLFPMPDRLRWVPTPPIALGFLLIAGGLFSHAGTHRSRRAVLGAAGLALSLMSLGVLGHYLQWLIGDERIYLLHTSPASALPQSLLALALVTLALFQESRDLPHWRLHRSLLVWSGVFAALLVGAWGLTTWANAAHLREEGGYRVASMATVLMEHFTRSFDPADLLLQEVATDVARAGLPERSQGEGRFGHLRLAVETLQQLDGLAIVDDQGRVRFESRRDVVPPPQALQALLGALTSDTPSVFGPVRRAGPGHGTLLYSRRLTGPSGSASGAVIVVLRVDYYLEFYRSLTLGPDALVSVLQRNGTVLLRYPGLSSGRIGQLWHDPGFHRMASEGSGVVAGASPLDGVPRLLGFRAATPLPVVLMTGIGTAPMADVFQRQYFASAALLSMALMLLAWAVTQQAVAADREQSVQQRLREAHDEVQASARHLGEIAATVPGLLYQWVARGDGTRGFRYVSPHAQVLFGLAPEHFGRLWWTRLHVADRPTVRKAMRAAVLACEPWSVEGRVTDGEGQERWVRMLARPTQAQDGEVVYTGFVIDITAERHGQAELERLATTDSLTGLLTRRQFHVLAEREIARHQRSGEPMAVLMLDVDHFKLVNDRHGHACGDAVLAAVALAMRTSLREVDILGRFGGEEFVAVLVETDLAMAKLIAERLRDACGHAEVPVADANGVTTVAVTVSIGLTQRLPGEDRLEAALRRADAALYRAKQHGRNRVEHEGASAA